MAEVEPREEEAQTSGELLRTGQEKLAQQTPAAAPSVAAGMAGDVPSLTLWGDVWRRLRKNRMAILGLGILITLALTAIFARWIAPYPFAEQNLSVSLQPPSAKHWFGTDILGRDYFSRVVEGSRISIGIGIGSVAIILTVGLTLGALGGYFGGWVDAVVMRIADLFLAFPYIVGVIVLITVFGEDIPGGPGFPRLPLLILAIGLFSWATAARIFRSSILQVKNLEYVEAARALGAGNARILLRHVVPNSLAPVMVFATIATGTVILTEAALSFLGLGVPVGAAAWGLMVSEGKSFLTSLPGLVIFPGVAIVLTVLGFIFLGDGLRDSMDPRLR